MKNRASFVFGTGLLCLFATASTAKPLAHKAVTHSAAKSPQSAAVRLVQRYLTARAAGEVEKAYALVTAAQRKQIPSPDQRDQMLRSLTGAEAQGKIPATMLPVLALFLDMHNTLHFKFRVLGASPDDPHVVFVRAYQVGTPLSTIKVIRVVTVSDPDSGGALRLDGERTAGRTDPAVVGAALGRAQQAVSQSNLKQISLGMLQYVQDHNEKCPDAARWVDEIMPYIKSEAVFHDPAAPDGEKWSYSLNRNLAGKSLARLQNPASTVLVFESTAGTKNASDAGESVPVPGRHSGGTDYAFADGHVRWLPDGSKASFSLTGLPPS